MINCRIGRPGWKIAARLGVPLWMKASVLRDEEARVFVATSDDFLPDFGCVAETETWDGLRKELDAVIADALETIFGRKAKKPEVLPAPCFASVPS